MDYCRLCAKNDKKHLIPILTDNPLKISDKIEKLFQLKVKFNIVNKKYQHNLKKIPSL